MQVISWLIALMKVQAALYTVITGLLITAPCIIHRIHIVIGGVQELRIQTPIVTISVSTLPAVIRH